MSQTRLISDKDLDRLLKQGEEYRRERESKERRRVNSRVSVRLLIKLRKEFPNLKIPKNAELRRLNHGHWQRSAGAWSWFLYHPKGIHNIGSQWSMKECLRSKNLVISSDTFDSHIIPEMEK